MAYTAYHDACTGQNDALFRMKERLKLHGWTVPDSGDGRPNFAVPGGGLHGNGTDVITSSGTSGSYVAGMNANIRAWFRLLSPAGAGGPELVFQHASGNQGTHQFAVWLVLNATDAPYAGATSDYPGQAPELFGRVFCRTTSFGVPDAAGAIFYSAVAGTLHMMIGDADEGYAWYAIYENTSTQQMGGFFFDAVADAHPDDETPYIAFVGGVGATNTLQSISDGRSFYAGPDGISSVGPNPIGYMGGYFSKTDDRDPSGQFQKRLVSFCITTPYQSNNSNIGIPTRDNPYGSGEIDVATGLGWFFTCYPYSIAFPIDAGRFKGTSRLIRGYGGASVASVGVTSTDQTLLHLGEGYWLVWDGATDINGAVDVYERTCFDAVEFSEPGDVLVTGIPMPVSDTGEPEYTTEGRRVVQAAYDSGTGSRVYWTSYGGPNTNPSPQTTTPNYTGILSGYHIVVESD